MLPSELWRVAWRYDPHGNVAALPHVLEALRGLVEEVNAQIDFADGAFRLVESDGHCRIDPENCGCRYCRAVPSILREIDESVQANVTQSSVE